METHYKLQEIINKLQDYESVQPLDIIKAYSETFFKFPMVVPFTQLEYVIIKDLCNAYIYLDEICIDLSNCHYYIRDGTTYHPLRKYDAEWELTRLQKKSQYTISELREYYKLYHIHIDTPKSIPSTLEEVTIMASDRLEIEQNFLGYDISALKCIFRIRNTNLIYTWDQEEK